MHRDERRDRRLGDLGDRGAHERPCRDRQLRAIDRIVHDDQHGGARRPGATFDAERIADRPVQHDARGGRAGQLGELPLETRRIVAIEAALVLDRAVDRWRAGDERDQEEPHGGKASPSPGSRGDPEAAICDYRSGVNAVVHLVSRLPVAAVRRLAALRVLRFDTGEPTLRGARELGEATAQVHARWGGDLCGLLNALSRGELAELARAFALPPLGRSPELRERLWDAGAALERGGAAISHALQPRPVLLGGHLVIQQPPRGLHPPSPQWPRAIPAAVRAAPPADEPETIDELLAAADRALGVRLGRRGRDKGAWGNRAAALLGIVERGDGEPDWRGDVEVKTVPVALEASGRWRIVEDPAIAMLGEPALAKLQRTLWLARSDVGAGDATIVTWYLLDWDAHIARLAHRYLHTRPKGPAGTEARGVYLSKRFFADAGLLATLNGWTP